jgi:hypothetical protein
MIPFCVERNQHGDCANRTCLSPCWGKRISGHVSPPLYINEIITINWPVLFNLAINRCHSCLLPPWYLLSACHLQYQHGRHVSFWGKVSSIHTVYPDRDTPWFYSVFTGLVGIALGYGLDDRGSGVRFPAGAGNFSLHHRVQNGSFPGSKAAEAWTWPLTSF